MDVKKQIIKAIQKATNIEQNDIHLEIPELAEHGDYASNVAMQMVATSKYKNPKEFAEDIKEKLSKDSKLQKYVSNIEVAGGGFINFWLSEDVLMSEMGEIFEENSDYGKLDLMKSKKIMIEYAHPNTHKELHIGHMRTLILGESLARILEHLGADVFRANYQGDIGPHVAKAIWGTQKILDEKKMTWDKAEKMSLSQKAHLLGQGYSRGVKDYEDEKNKKEIDALNTKIYQKEKDVMTVYERTRRWSLDYYDTFYSRFYTKYDRFYFESEVEKEGKEIVLANLGKVFEKSQGAVIFDGEKYGLHKRVFITKDGNPTYEAKDMALAPLQYSDFPFDLNIHVVANEQIGYFKVVFKALALIDKKFEGREYHLPMGMVNLVGKKMSSRTGEILRVDELIDEVKDAISKLVDKSLSKKEKEEVTETIAIGAIKYWMLKTNPAADILFDIKKSVDLQGNSGPYLQYTYARTQSVLKKAKSKKLEVKKLKSTRKMEDEELALLRTFAQCNEVLLNVGKNYSPNLLCNYLFDLAQKFNSFYNKFGILEKRTKDKEKSEFRIALTSATGQIIKNGLETLGIKAPKQM